MFDSIYIHHIYTSRTSTVGRPARFCDTGARENDVTSGLSFAKQWGCADPEAKQNPIPQ